MKAIIFFITSSALCLGQLKFEKVKITQILDPKENSTTVSFPFSATTDTEISGFFTHCGCLKAISTPKAWTKNSTGALELSLDTRNIVGKTRKSIEVQFKNHPKQTLTVEATLPAAISWNPKTHIWKKDTPSSSKNYEITIHEDYQFSIKEFTLSNKKFKAELTEAPMKDGEKAKRFILSVTPPASGQKETCMIKVTTTSGIKRYHSFHLLAIRQ